MKIRMNAMKRFCLLLCMMALALLLTVALVSCGEEPASTESESTTSAVESTTATPATTPVTTEMLVNGLPEYVDGKLFIIEDGKTNYKVTFAQGANTRPTTGSVFKDALSSLRKAFKNYGFQLISITNDAIPLGQEDTFVAPEYEILLGDTNREESKIATDELAFNQAIMRVVGKKIVIVGKTDTLTAMAILKFIETYMPEDGKAVLVPSDLNEIVTLDVTQSTVTGMSYADMADDVWDSFNNAYWNGTWVQGAGWWDAAEILETYVDVYEQTRSDEDKAKMLNFATGFIRNHNFNWSYNEYNDDIMWACIAFARISDLTGNKTYARYAKQNFDTVWARAWDNKLGGGLYWRVDNTTKNSCVNCPAAIAACLIGKLYDDEGYFEIAKKIMDWEIKWMFEPATGRVYDAYPLVGEISKWASTYNQGTFIGACTLLYQHYKEDIYMTHADKAASFAMKSLTTDGILHNGEGNPDSGNGDLPGFKGILTRWLYRYAKEAESLDVLTFLQNNAAVAYQNRNKDGVIWTNWVEKTPDDATHNANYRTFGMSTAVALMYNCQQWW